MAAKLEIAQLNEALVSRATIDQAKGMIMASVHCDEHAAFAFLKRISQDANVKVRDIASVMAEHVRCGGDPMECLERYLPRTDDTA